MKNTNDNEFLDDNGDNIENKKPAEGNTLDYYYDDISRKAVGKLFLPEEENIKPITTIQEDDEDSGTVSVNDSGSGKYVGVPKLSEGRDILSESATKHVDDEEYNFSLYRKKENQDFFEDTQTETQKAENKLKKRAILNLDEDYLESPNITSDKKVVKENNILENEQTKEQTKEQTMQAYKKIEPRNTASSRRTEEKHANNPVAKPVRKTNSEPTMSKTPQKRKRQEIESPPVKKSRQAQSVYAYDKDDFENDSVSKKTIVFAGIIFILVLLSAVLVFALMSSNKKLDEANATIDELATLKVQSTDLAQQNDSLRGENEALKAELKALKPAPVDGTNAEDGTAQDITDENINEVNDETSNGTDNGTDDGTDNGTDNSTTNNQSNQKVYTVVSGDSLGKISKKFYGTEADYEKIVEANDLEGTDISPGQELIIPQ